MRLGFVDVVLLRSWQLHVSVCHVANVTVVTAVLIQ